MSSEEEEPSKAEHKAIIATDCRINVLEVKMSMIAKTNKEKNDA